MIRHINIIIAYAHNITSNQYQHLKLHTVTSKSLIDSLRKKNGQGS